MKLWVLVVWLHEVGGAPPEDVHISNLPLNANAHGRFDFWRSPSIHEVITCAYKIY